jgi:hypothetical protein
MLAATGGSVGGVSSPERAPPVAAEKRFQNLERH